MKEKENLVTSQSRDWCFDIVLLTYIRTQQLIVSLTQKQTPPIHGPQGRLCPQNKSNRGEVEEEEEGVSLH